MAALAAGLALYGLGAVLMRRDLRGLYRRWAWRRAPATLHFEPGPAWRIDFVLPDGRAVSVRTRDLRLVARRREQGPLTVLYDPRAPGRAVEIPAPPGLGLVAGLAMAGLGVAAMLRG